MRVLNCGDSAALIECVDAAEARFLAAALSEEVLLTLGARTVLVRAARTETLALIANLDAVELAEVEFGQSEHHVIGVRYDGPDLTRVADHAGLTPAEVVDAHTSAIQTVGFAGFAPGFAYLVGGDPRLHVPRLDVPRPRVAAGSVALAGPYSGIYPRESAGGWLIIGHTSDWLWDIDRTIPARFAPGDSVTFEAI
jgi:KipI family sensor histidine kinase inhibitor